MAFDDYEYSEYQGEPVELFLFEDDIALNKWAYTTGEAPVEVGSVTYLPNVIRRSSVKQSGRESPDSMTVEIPENDALALQFRDYLPARPISLKVFRYHRKDGTGFKQTMFIGTANSANLRKEGLAALACQPIHKTTMRRVPWQVYKAGCNWALYGPGCNVLKEAFVLDRPALTAVTGDTLKSNAFAGFADGWFSNGYVEVAETGEVRFITGHVGDTLTLIYPFQTVTTATELLVYPGCDRTVATCRDKFNNLPRYLGFDFVPSKSPFEDPLDNTLSTSAPTSVRSFFK